MARYFAGNDCGVLQNNKFIVIYGVCSIPVLNLSSSCRAHFFHTDKLLSVLLIVIDRFNIEYKLITTKITTKYYL